MMYFVSVTDGQLIFSSHLLAAGCTFEEDSDPNLCDFTQGEEDDFDWLLFRTQSSPSANSDLLKGEYSVLMVPCPLYFVVFLDTETRHTSMHGTQAPCFHVWEIHRLVCINVAGIIGL